MPWYQKHCLALAPDLINLTHFTQFPSIFIHMKSPLLDIRNAQKMKKVTANGRINRKNGEISMPLCTSVVNKLLQATDYCREVCTFLSENLSKKITTKKLHISIKDAKQGNNFFLDGVIVTLQSFYSSSPPTVYPGSEILAT